VEDWLALPKKYMIILTWGETLLLPQKHFFFSPASVRAIKSPSGWFEHGGGGTEKYNKFVEQVHQKNLA
jgi:hypothetical protein